MSQEFKPQNKGDIFEYKSKIIKNNVLKNQTVKVNNAKKIISHQIESESTRTNITPIKNNEEIIGVMTECHCGEVIKIYFNYESGQTAK